MAETAFGTQLRESRKAAALSLRQLAVRVGYDHSYLSQVERGQRPGSADLARLCDRELGTGWLLTTIYQQADRRAIPAVHKTAAVATAQIGSPIPPVDTSASGAASLDPLEAAWFGMVDTFAHGEAGDVWRHLADPRSTPPARVLPELIADLRLLQVSVPSRSPADAAARATQLGVHIAETLTAVGQPYAAKRWWRVARVVADRSEAVWAHGLVRVREALSGVTQRRPLAQLLELADEGLSYATQAPSGLGCVAQGHAARALVLAGMGRTAEAHQALQELVGVELPAASTTYASLGDWAPYEVHGAEGRVCASLGYGTAGCVMLSRALELCPVEWLGERAGLEIGLAECLVLDGEVAAGLALALRVLVELPDEWHTYYLYYAGQRVLSAVREKEPGRTSVRDLQELLQRAPYLDRRSVGTGSSARR